VGTAEALVEQVRELGRQGLQELRLTEFMVALAGLEAKIKS